MRTDTKAIVQAFLSYLVIDVVWPREARAYLDPGTGSMLISAIVGIFATVLFLFRGLHYRVRALFLGAFGVQIAGGERHGIVFYSEGAQYWPTFEPVLTALDGMGVSCTYLTSDRDDPGLSYGRENVRSEYIGTAYRAYATLNVLEADVCILTTPGLDVLQIKRSKGVRHYVHLVHSVSDIGSYKQFSFDYFDTVMTAADHQIEALRALEAVRGTDPKALLRTGCCYMDRMRARLGEAEAGAGGEEIRVLVSPTWGSNGLLSRFGSRLPKVLLDAGFDVVVRPHPQSHVSETKLLASLHDELLGYPNLRWDDAPDPFQSLLHADVLVSDLSGIVFDFAFVFGKPVVSVRFDYDATGMEASDLPGDLWELGVLDQIGFHLGEEDLETLPQRIRSVVGTEDLRDSILRVREQHLFNPGEAGPTAARQIVEIQKRVADPTTAPGKGSAAAAVT